MADFRIPADPKFVLNSFGVICFGLVGLELASVMGDEIREPQKTLPGAVAWGGVISGALYVGATLTLLVAIGKNDINVLQGIVQAVSHMAGKVGVAWIIAPFAVMLSLSIAGIGSAWMGGSARIPFVAGLDSYMPAAMGKSSSPLCNPARCPDRARLGVAGPDRPQLHTLRRRAGSLSENALSRRGVAIGAVSLRLRCADKVCHCVALSKDVTAGERSCLLVWLD